MLSSGLTGQRVLVTASSSGIGLGAARAFLEEGARVVISSSGQSRLQKAHAELKSLGEVHQVVADLRKKEDIDRLVDETARILGGIDTLVYVTGSPAPGVFMEQSYENWQEAASLLVVSPAHLAHRVADVMLKEGVKGRMVFLASYAIREPIPNIALSDVCRIAIGGLVRTLGRELAPKGIRVNAILPGSIKTPRIDQILRDTSKRKGISETEALQEMEKQIPLGYIATPAELARSIIFLGSEMSSYVTGTMLAVDGGLLRSVG